MLSRAHRLNKREDIETVFKRGKSVYAGSLGLRLTPNKLLVTRLAVVVSLKVSKKAVERNRLKRRLREIARREILPRAKSGFDGLLLTQKPLLELPFPKLRELTLELFKKAKLL